MVPISWFKVDDTLNAHPKTRRAGLPAMGLWVVAGSYASQYLTEGFVPEWYVLSWPAGKKLAAELVRAGLWVPAESEGEAGWQFHQWDERNPSKEEVLAKREVTRERLRAWRSKRSTNTVGNAVTNGVTDGVTSAVTNGVTNVVTNSVSNALPDPTRPDPTRPASPTEKQVEELHTVDSANASPTRADRFDEFWAAYPSRGEHANPKKPAKLKWDRATKTTDPEIIIAAARRYAATRRGDDPRHTAQAVTWLSQERWADTPAVIEAAAPALINPPKPPADMPEHLFGAWNRAHAEAHRNGSRPPTDWRQLREAS